MRRIFDTIFTSDSSASLKAGQLIPVEHGLDIPGLVVGSQPPPAGVHSTPLTCTPSPHETEHYNKNFNFKIA